MFKHIRQDSYQDQGREPWDYIFRFVNFVKYVQAYILYQNGVDDPKYKVAGYHILT